MKGTLVFLILFFFLNDSSAQQFESDLFETWTSNTLNDFKKSSFKRMTVTTNRMVTNTPLTETTTTYRKSKLNALKVSFSILYTPHYVLDARKKSKGNYIINKDSKVLNYQRTDIGEKNKMLGTIYHNLYYTSGIVTLDQNRFKEYLNVGAVDMDTVVTHDSSSYSIRISNDTTYQTDLLSKNTYTSYILKENVLLEKIYFINGYSENYRYVYNTNNKLEQLILTLKSSEGKTAKNVYKFQYNSNGLISKAEFFGQSNDLIEEKIFTYK